MSAIGQFPPLLNKSSVTIAGGDQDSAALDLRGTTLLGIVLPALLTGTSFTFKVSFDGQNFIPFHDATAIISVTVAPSIHVALNPSDFASAKFIKVVSSSAEAAARIIELISRPV